MKRQMGKGSLVKALFLQYGADLKRYLTLKFGDSYDNEDIVQDSFRNLLSSVEPESLDNPRAYLFQTAHNLALNRIRKQGHYDRYASMGHSEEDELSPERIVIAQGDIEALLKTLGELPENCQRAFIAHRVHSRSYQDIADELGVSVSSVEKYLMRTMKFLRENFDG